MAKGIETGTPIEATIGLTVVRVVASEQNIRIYFDDGRKVELAAASAISQHVTRPKAKPLEFTRYGIGVFDANNDVGMNHGPFDFLEDCLEIVGSKGEYIFRLTRKSSRVIRKCDEDGKWVKLSKSERKTLDASLEVDAESDEEKDD